MVTKPQGVVVLAAAVLMAGLAGCTPSAPVGTTPPQPTESSTPEPVFEPLAGGECDALLPTADVAAALGGATDVNASFSGEGLPQLAIVGGLQCRWYFGEQGSPDATDALLSVVPADIAAPGEIDNAAANVCEQSEDLLHSNSGCLVDTQSSGWWYELRVYTFTTPQGQSDSTRAVDSLVQQAIAKATPSAPIEILPAVDCAAAVPGATSSREPVSADNGAIAVAADRLASPTRCAFSIDGVAWGGAEVFPGTTAAYDQCLHQGDGALAEVPDVTEAFIPTFEQVPQICVTDGTSSAVLTGPGEFMEATPWTDAQLAQAGRVAASFLAVASG